MKPFLFRTSVIVLTTFTSILHADSPAPLEVILVAGQSNAVGFDAKASDLSADPDDKNVLFWWRCGDPPPDEHDTTSGGKWAQLQPQPRGEPMAKDAGVPRQYGNFSSPAGFGPEIGLARTLRAKEHKPLAIVKAAFSGTAMAQDWNPADPGAGGSCYRALVAETKAALAAAKANGAAPHLRALVWVQGESDANENAAALYTEALGGMIAALRKDLDAPQLNALIAVNTHFGGGKNVFMPKIVEAQKALAAKDSHCAYVDTETATVANAVHFDSAGTLDVGARFAVALLKIEAKSNEPTNATEAAAKKAAADNARDERYQKWKASLPPEQQAWETVLEQNLGAFYLPIHK
ncbi:MAG: sialate O-acetylesterase, partial [Chthoniobacteraceae bacterium]